MAFDDRKLKKKAGDLLISVKAVIFHRRKVLLLRQPCGTWELPGGKLESNEKIIDALHREVREETGLKIKSPNLLDTWVRTKDDGTQRFVVSFHCTPVKRLDPKRIQISDEHDDLCFVEPADMLELDMLDGYTRAIRLALKRDDLVLSG